MFYYVISIVKVLGAVVVMLHFQVGSWNLELLLFIYFLLKFRFIQGYSFASNKCK